VHQVDTDLLQHAGADAAEHVLAALPLDDDGVDAALVKELAQQEPGRAGSDDGNLGTHAFLTSLEAGGDCDGIRRRQVVLQGTRVGLFAQLFYRRDRPTIRAWFPVAPPN